MTTARHVQCFGFALFCAQRSHEHHHDGHPEHDCPARNGAGPQLTSMLITSSHTDR
ncbi:hypothetical protein DFR71_2772 [Nocardia alba]|uniref:Uncharacterized protein n=1 Tax=Nocardia alba TaxID=225051 RepID=A0A4R1FT50_9NOCA|nr:hypothetical protein DFR71_2772 [Nocardia alba]